MVVAVGCVCQCVGKLTGLSKQLLFVVSYTSKKIDDAVYIDMACHMRFMFYSRHAWNIASVGEHLLMITWS